MKLPKTVLINRKRFIFKTVKSRSYFGRIYYQDREIRLSTLDRKSGKMPSAKRMDETLVHELTHGVLYEMGLKALAFDEKFVTRFAKLFNNAIYSLKY